MVNSHKVGQILVSRPYVSLVGEVKVYSKENGTISDTVMQRQEAVLLNYTTSIEPLLDNIDALLNSKDKDQQRQNVNKTRAHLKKVKREKKEKFLGSDQLPHRSVNREALARVLGESLIPSYTYGTGLTNLTPWMDIFDYPVPHDTIETIDAQITPEIEDLAEMLGHDPIRIYEFVRNNFDYEPYYGSVKGSQETLWEEAGNDVDLASLLIALYRASGIPARYVYGQIELPIEQAMNLVGVEDEQTAGNVFASGGVPGVLIIQGGRITKIRFTLRKLSRHHEGRIRQDLDTARPVLQAVRVPRARCQSDGGHGIERISFLGRSDGQFSNQ
jgi:hypothetical protein